MQKTINGLFIVAALGFGTVSAVEFSKMETAEVENTAAKIFHGAAGTVTALAALGCLGGVRRENPKLDV
ncbi:MAG: hypothetical protein H6868_04320 [Rhodospirillales bacterium]|nr:hypothetical protein [Rhodospirillales bacterium]